MPDASRRCGLAEPAKTLELNEHVKTSATARLGGRGGRGGRCPPSGLFKAAAGQIEAVVGATAGKKKLKAFQGLARASQM